MSDAREAAKRLREFKANYSYEYRNTKMGADCQTLAEEYLVEHPADEGEQITREWLASIGFKPVPSGSGPNYDDHMEMGLLNLWDFNGQCWVVDDADWMELHTRRQVYQLLSALGIGK